MANPVVHWEMWSEDPERASAFYSKVFSWNIRAIPEMDYHFAESGGDSGIGGGIMKPKAGPWLAKMTMYIDVDDLAVYREKIVEAGGKIIVEQVDMSGVGSLSLFEDPDGRVIGLWKQLPKETKEWIHGIRVYQRRESWYRVGARAAVSRPWRPGGGGVPQSHRRAQKVGCRSG